jgi:hypothetical protein
MHSTLTHIYTHTHLDRDGKRHIDTIQTDRGKNGVYREKRDPDSKTEDKERLVHTENIRGRRCGKHEIGAEGGRSKPAMVHTGSSRLSSLPSPPHSFPSSLKHKPCTKFISLGPAAQSCSASHPHAHRTKR